MDSTTMRNAVLAAVASVFACGCGAPPPPQIVSADGVVLLDGAPLAMVEVRFIPSSGPAAGYTARGTTDKAGRFTLTCKGQPGACTGENHVVVTEAELPAGLRSERAQNELAAYLNSLGGRPLPEKYTSLAANPLIVQVSEEQAHYKIELRR